MIFCDEQISYPMAEGYDSNMRGEEPNLHSPSGEIFQSYTESEIFDSCPLDEGQEQSDADSETDLQIVSQNYEREVESVACKIISSRFSSQDSSKYIANVRDLPLPLDPSSSINLNNFSPEPPSFSRALKPTGPQGIPDDSFASPFRVFTRSTQQIVDAHTSPSHFNDAFLWSNSMLSGRESPQFVSPVGSAFEIPSLNTTDPLLGHQVEGSALFYPLADEESMPFSQTGLDLSQTDNYLTVCTLFPHCINSTANIHIRR
jgi:hypothetical protein